MEPAVDTVTFTVADRAAARRRLGNAFQGKKQGAQISFESLELLFETMTANRWQIIKALIGAGPVSIREAARKVGKDVSGVHKDVRVLLDAGILRKAGDKIEFPYSGVHLDATLTQEAAE
jgi:predicted transcriptional regulator